MPKRGKLLSAFEQGQIIRMTESGRSISEISRHISRKYNGIKNFLARDGDYKHGGGPSKKLSEKNKRQIIRKVSTEGAKSLRKIKSELNLSVPKYTIGKFLKEEGYKYKAKKQPALTPEKTERRLKSAKQLVEELTERKLGVEYITFTDEKRFLLDGPEGMQYYWCLDGEERKWYGKKISLKVLWLGEVLEQTEQLRYTSATGTWIQNITSTYYEKTTCRFTNHISFLCKITYTTHIRVHRVFQTPQHQSYGLGC